MSLVVDGSVLIVVVEVAVYVWTQSFKTKQIELDNRRHKYISTYVHMYHQWAAYEQMKQIQMNKLKPQSLLQTKTVSYKTAYFSIF